MNLSLKLLSILLTAQPFLIATALATPIPPDRQVGACLVVGVAGTTLDSATRKALSSGRIAGIILLGDNIESVSQVKKLTGAARKAAKAGGQPPPLLCIDQEGGKVNRLATLDGFPDDPSAAHLAKLGPKEVEAVSFDVSSFIKGLGLNVNFAPDLDLDEGSGVIGTRAYSLKPEVVLESAAAMIRGSKRAGVCTVVKHFPGHGLTHVDSHYTLPVLKPSAATLEKHEGVFGAIMDADPEGAMLGHLLVKPVDPKYPSSLSKPFAAKLRSIVGDSRLIFTDSGSMDALGKYGSQGARAARALSVGDDIYLTTTPYSALGKKFNEGVYGKVSSHEILRRAGERVRAWRTQNLQ